MTPTPKARNCVPLTTHVDPDRAAEVVAIAAADGRSVSQYLRRLIAADIAARLPRPEVPRADSD